MKGLEVTGATNILQIVRINRYLLSTNRIAPVFNCDGMGRRFLCCKQSYRGVAGAV